MDLEAVLKKHGVPWSLTRSGARCEMQFMPTLPGKRNGGQEQLRLAADVLHPYLSVQQRDY